MDSFMIIIIYISFTNELKVWCTSGEGSSLHYLPFISHDNSSWTLYTNVDDEYEYVELPFNVSFGTSKQNGTYIGSNGYITFESGYAGYNSQQFPINRIMLSPYWTDIYIKSPNAIYYKIFDGPQATSVMEDINSFLQGSTSTQATMTAALVVKWVDVCPLGNTLCALGNTFQIVLTSDSTSKESYAIFTYKCGELNWLQSPTTIGYSADDNFYHNHYLSRQSNVNSIACVNQPQSNWSNVVFKLSINTLPFMDLPASVSSLQKDDDSAVHIDLQSVGQIFFGNNSYTSLYASSNGLVSFGNSYTNATPDSFPILQKVIAPYWDDIELLLDGSMQYYVANDGQIKTEVDYFLNANLSINFSASTILIVKWINVCHYNSECSQRNSFQLVLATDDYFGTYSIFSYKCGLLNWVKHKASIGFSASMDFYANHRLSQNESVNDIACLNYPATSWSNVVYQVNKQVIVELSIQEITDEIVALNGSSVSLNCTVVVGIPRPYIQWEGDEDMLSNGDITEQSLYQNGTIVSTLTITLLGNATFNCTAWNNWSDRVVEQAHVIAQIPPVITTSFIEISVLIGQPLTIMCSVHGYPIPTVQWRKNGQGSIITNSGQQTTNIYHSTNTAVSYLMIIDSSYEDGGNYVCHAENQLAIHIEKEHDIAKIVMYSHMSAFISHNASVTVQAGSNVMLECIITGVLHPSTILSWRKYQNNSLDDYTVIDYVNITTTRVVLTIPSITLSNMGDYTCSAENSFASAYDSINIAVQVLPVITTLFTELSVLIGQPITVVCSVYGYPIPTVQWKKNGSIVVDSGQQTTIVYYNNTVVSYLTINDSTYEDDGDYICHAENQLAIQIETEFTIARIIIYSEMSAFVSQDMITTTQGRNVTLECIITGVLHPLTVLSWHQIPNNESSSLVDHTVIIYENITTTRVTLTISFITVTNEGEYTCLAENPFYSSNDSLYIVVQVLEEKHNPTGTTGVTVIPISIAAVSVISICLVLVVVCIIQQIMKRRNKSKHLKGSENTYTSNKRDSTYATVDKSNKRDSTYATVDKSNKQDSTYATVDKSNKQDSTYATVDKSNKRDSTYATVDKSNKRDSTYATVDKSNKRDSTYATVDKRTSDSIPTVNNAVYGIQVPHPTKIPSPNDDEIPTVTNPTYELGKHSTRQCTQYDNQNHYESCNYIKTTTETMMIKHQEAWQ